MPGHDTLTPYSPRTVRFIGLRQFNDYRIKKYTIAFDESPVNLDSFEAAFEALALPSLPVTAITRGRPGVGFVIFHHGRTGDYLVLGWWDRENELPLRTWIREDTAWREIRGSEGVCVWDLEVIWRERCHYVATVLKAGVANAIDEYCRLTGIES